jgi:hypothetical protein
MPAETKQLSRENTWQEHDYNRNWSNQRVGYLHHWAEKNSY